MVGTEAEALLELTYSSRVSNCILIWGYLVCGCLSVGMDGMLYCWRSPLSSSIDAEPLEMEENVWHN